MRRLPGERGAARDRGARDRGAFTEAAAVLTLLDPTTLADRADLPALPTGVLERLASWVLSGDGSTLVAFDQRFRLDPARTTAVVTDLPSGAGGSAGRRACSRRSRA